jgi:hypothetical protein
MIEDMSVRKFGEKTRQDYIRHVEAFAKFLGARRIRQPVRTCADRETIFVKAPTSATAEDQLLLKA